MLPAGGVRELPFAERYSSDERLARLVARGSTRAFAVLYERHHATLSRYCRSIVGNDDDAQDALQSAMTRALAALQSGERELHVRPWLFRIVHNEAISLLRRRRASAPIDESIPAANGVEHALEQRERLATLVADLQTLTERQRSVLLMRELAGLSIAEIAGAQSLSPGAAKQALFEARCALHELVDGRRLACEVVRLSVEEHDGRVLRGRKLRAHLRVCDECRNFRAVTERRSTELRMLVPPLPFVATGLALARTTGGNGAGVASVTTSATAGGHAAGSFAVKLLAGATLMTAAADGTLHVASVHRRVAPRSAMVARTHGNASFRARALVLARADAPPPAHHHAATAAPHALPALRVARPAPASMAPTGATRPDPTTTPASPSLPSPPADQAAPPPESTPTSARAPVPPASSKPHGDPPPQATGASSPGPPADPAGDHDDPPKAHARPQGDDHGASGNGNVQGTGDGKASDRGKDG